MVLSRASKISTAYHALFDYPLSKEELEKWKVGDGVKIQALGYKTRAQTALWRKRKQKEKYSQEKLKIARKAAGLLGKIPTVKMIAVTGSLAMLSAAKNSDIDLMLITSKSALWTTRLSSYLTARLVGLKIRKPRDKNAKDKLCFNIWMDESDLLIEKQNIFTAHEICQIMPLVNKDETYERFLWVNRWVLRYWPKAVKIQKISRSRFPVAGVSLFEKLAYWFQYQYLKRKITRETVTPTRAFFHPVDWSTRLENQFGLD